MSYKINYYKTTTPNLYLPVVIDTAPFWKATVADKTNTLLFTDTSFWNFLLDFKNSSPTPGSGVSESIYLTNGYYFNLSITTISDIKLVLHASGTTDTPLVNANYIGANNLNAFLMCYPTSPGVTNYSGCQSYISGGSVMWADNQNQTNYLTVVNAFLNGAEIKESFPGYNSGSGGGTGSFDSTSDSINFPAVPTLSAVNAGFITLYSPTVTQLNELAAYMWSSAFDIASFKKLFADPMDVIIGLSIVPVAVPTSSSQEVKVGFIGTGITMNLASTQYLTVDCGTLTPTEFWGSALDYSPYTKFSIYLPYIGTREIKTDDIMGKSVQVKYNIDILTGSCTAMIKCGDSILYEFSGACASSIPVTGQNWSQLLTSCIQLAGTGIAVAATGGAAAGMIPATANAVMAMKPSVQRSGGVSGSAGMLGVQQPYLIWELPRQSLATNYNTFVGYPSNITSLLSSLTGYTQIESIHIENITATQTELAEIESLLKEGVII